MENQNDFFGNLSKIMTITVDGKDISFDEMESIKNKKFKKVAK